VWEGAVRDSAGVTVVENEGPDRTGGEAPWRAETSLTIDTVFGHVVDVASSGPAVTATRRATRTCPTPTRGPQRWPKARNRRPDMPTTS